MLLSAQSIRREIDISPFAERTVRNGMSFGLSSAGYDIRIKLDELVKVLMPGDFVLATTIEHLSFPHFVMGMLVDKSSWARKGLSVQNTVFEPGWRGYPTIEINNHSSECVPIHNVDPIAQMIFMWLDKPTDQPYSGKYQDQPQMPVAALEEA